MELGKGYAFIGRQYHIHTDESDYYVDLVFYNYSLKCFVLIDLKTNKISCIIFRIIKLRVFSFSFLISNIMI